MTILNLVVRVASKYGDEPVVLTRFYADIYYVSVPPVLATSLRYDDLVRVTAHDIRVISSTDYCVAYARLGDEALGIWTLERAARCGAIISIYKSHAAISFRAPNVDAVANIVVAADRCGVLKILNPYVDL